MSDKRIEQMNIHKLVDLLKRYLEDHKDECELCKEARLIVYNKA